MCWVNTEITLHSKNYRKKLSIESHGRKSQRRVNSSLLLWVVTLLDVTKPLLTRCRKSKPFAYPKPFICSHGYGRVKRAVQILRKIMGVLAATDWTFVGLRCSKCSWTPLLEQLNTGDNFIHSRGKNWLKKLSFLLLSQYVTFIKGAVLIHGIPS